MNNTAFSILTEKKNDVSKKKEDEEVCGICLEPSFQPVRYILQTKDKNIIECKVKNNCCLICTKNYLEKQVKKGSDIKCIYNCCSGSLPYSIDFLHPSSYFKNRNYKDWKSSYEKQTLNMTCGKCATKCLNFREFLLHSDYLCIYKDIECQLCKKTYLSKDFLNHSC